MPPARPDSPVGRANGPQSLTTSPRDQPDSSPKTNRIERNRNSNRNRSRTRPPGLTARTEPAHSLRTSPGVALETLLVDLGSQIRRGSLLAEEVRPAPGLQTGHEAGCHPTGLPLLDTLLGGGFPSDRLSEICGSSPYKREGVRNGRSSGRTALALGVLAETLGRGVLAAWVDLADAFDPPSALEAVLAHGGEPEDLDRLLWVRARSEDEALRSCERLLKTEGFELVILDALLPGSLSPPRMSEVTWLRFARLANQTRTALILLSSESITGSRAAVVLEMQAHRAHFVGPPLLLDAIETRAILRRHRNRPCGQEIVLSIQAEDEG